MDRPSPQLHILPLHFLLPWMHPPHSHLSLTTTVVSLFSRRTMWMDMDREWSCLLPQQSPFWRLERYQHCQMVGQSCRGVPYSCSYCQGCMCHSSDISSMQAPFLCWCWDYNQPPFSPWCQEIWEASDHEACMARQYWGPGCHQLAWHQGDIHGGIQGTVGSQLGDESVGGAWWDCDSIVYIWDSLTMYSLWAQLVGLQTGCDQSQPGF